MTKCPSSYGHPTWTRQIAEFTTKSRLSLLTTYVSECRYVCSSSCLDDPARSRQGVNPAKRPYSVMSETVHAGLVVNPEAGVAREDSMLID